MTGLGSASEGSESRLGNTADEGAGRGDAPATADRSMVGKGAL